MGTKKKIKKSETIPAEQGKYEVGYGKPPQEYQFKPGQSGNPDGPPNHRTNLWVWICKYMNMTDSEMEKLNGKNLTQVQQVALRMVESAKAGRGLGCEKLVRYIVDREEGRAMQTQVVEDMGKMSLAQALLQATRRKVKSTDASPLPTHRHLTECDGHKVGQDNPIEGQNAQT